MEAAVAAAHGTGTSEAAAAPKERRKRTGKKKRGSRKKRPPARAREGYSNSRIGKGGVAARATREQRHAGVVVDMHNAQDSWTLRSACDRRKGYISIMCRIHEFTCVREYHR
jgi:hypothetical protein